MSKTPKMDKKMARRMQIAEVEVAESGAWDFSIGEHLRGKLQPGDIVVVVVPNQNDDGESELIMRVGRVNELKPISSHRPEHVFSIVDKVRFDRYLETRRRMKEAADLYTAACERARMLEQLGKLRSTAEEAEDGELLEMVDNLEKMHSCKDANEESFVDAEAPAWVDPDSLPVIVN